MKTIPLPVKLIALAAAAVLLVGACGQSDTADPTTPAQTADLSGRTFTFTDVQVSDTGAPPPNDGDGISLTFTDSGISATGGCNTMSGDATVDNGVLLVSDGLAMTEMACDAALMDQDTWFADLLTAKPDLEVSGETLTLATGGTVLTLTDGTSSQPEATLVGPKWQLDSIIESDAVSSVPMGVTATLEFSTEGDVSVNTGCNSGSGGYTVDGDTIVFGPIATTLKGCGGGAGNVETAVTRTLDGTVTYTIDADSLTIMNDDQGLVYRVA